MSRSKERVIEVIAKGDSKKFPRIFAEVDRLLKKQGKKRRTQYVLAVALQIYYMQDCKGCDEFMESKPEKKDSPPPLRDYRTDRQLSLSRMLRIKTSTLSYNLKTYFKYKNANRPSN